MKHVGIVGVHSVTTSALQVGTQKGCPSDFHMRFKWRVEATKDGTCTTEHELCGCINLFENQTSQFDPLEEEK